MADAAEIQRLRDRITQMLKRVPTKVNAGGLETARKYKAAALYAQKQLASARASFANLQQAHNQLASYEG